MNKVIAFLFVLVLAAVLTAAKPNEPNPTATKQKMFLAAVIRIYDGDTVLVRYNGLRCLVRLWGIDAPERKQSGGKESIKYLVSLIKNRTVKLVPVESGKYGRLIARIYKGKTFINLEMIKAGHAWWYKNYAPNAKELEKAQQNAKLHKCGFWQNPNPIEPRIWRQTKK